MNECREREEKETSSSDILKHVMKFEPNTEHDYNIWSSSRSIVNVATAKSHARE